ncbi:tetratricopeptide repeat protein [Swaminathania salitolerans]|uniref:Uncharacterized protein n=1 Tax=Swaminathania salitolerans TaxID=182838 RepID=A0A511BX65_9PROT|nr:tetratricopeptide repeat protein [Swaminathania salitolerans]GBQ11719.1 hypothetical protein AA21291_0938 [Swaminathania salitolerans LMG 21291]GEL02598.1 hypothetical protein SSA02_17610 [Swaminathania salitolerans]
MQTKHSPSLYALLVCSVLASGWSTARAAPSSDSSPSVSSPAVSSPSVSSPSGAAMHGASAGTHPHDAGSGHSGPAGAHFDPSAYSLTGGLLGSIVSVQRNNIPDADRALYGVVTHGYRAPDLMLMALRYAAMDAGTDAARRARTLAQLQPKESLARIVLGVAAFHARAWRKAERYFSLHAKAPQSFLRLAGQGLRDWCQFGAHPGTGRQGTGRPALPHDAVGYLALMQEARIASLRDEKRTEKLFALLDANAQAVPPLLRLQTLQFEADWLAAHRHADEARQKLAQAGAVLPAFQLVASRLVPQQIGLSFPPDQGLAEFFISVTALLGDTTPHEGGPGEETLKDVRQLKILLLRQALYLDPHMTLARILLSEELRADGQLDMAQSALDGVEEADPLAPLSDHAQAQIALKREDVKAALHALTRVARANPDNPDILSELGMTQNQLGLAKEAVATFTRAIDHVSVMQAHIWPLLLGRAMAWDHLGARAKAQSDLDRALALAPSEPVLLNYAGYSDVEHDERPEQALALLGHAMVLAPDDAEIRDSYGWALLKQNGDLAKALPLLLSAVNAAPGDAEIAYHLGVAYWYQGRQLEARDQWNQALNNKPEPATKALIEAALAHGPDLPVMRGRPIPAAR